jgi:putative flavoprotein involved in K+ transport
MRRLGQKRDEAGVEMDGGGVERLETVIIGGGQAGLALGYHLARRGRPFVILDASKRVGDAWRNRWDSLRLFTPVRYDGLPGWPFPAPARSFPTKDQVADYLEAYAARFELPVRTGVGVTGLSRMGNRYVVVAGNHRFEADHVVVASGAYHSPRVPAFAAELDPDIVQLHSTEYRDGSRLRDGDVLVVGAGNSGAEIANDVSRGHRTWLSGRDTGHIPFRLGSVWDRLLTPPFLFVGAHLLTVRTPVGRKARAKMRAVGAPLERVHPKDLAAAGVERVPRTTGVHKGYPVLDDGRIMDVANVIWCTGFVSGLDWIDLPVLDETGEPRHRRGVAVGEPGLYFVGRFFLHAFTSALLAGVGRDAEHIARHIARATRHQRDGTRISR